MVKPVKRLLLAGACISCICLATTTRDKIPLDKHHPKNQQDDYKLIWADEFNTDGPVDTATTGNLKLALFVITKLQWFQRQKCILQERHILIIEARRTHA
jgi:predicted transposase YdaD